MTKLKYFTKSTEFTQKRGRWYFSIGLATLLSIYTTIFQLSTSYLYYFSGFLTLGIPTVKRRFNDYYYLNVTVSGLIQNIDPEMVRQIVIVIFMADSDISWNMRTAQKIFLTFQPQFESGLLQIIHISPNVYPQFSLLRKMGTDSVERVRWRTKQNVDFALVMLYSRSLNTYYMQLEDDLSVAPDFFNDIQSYVQKQKGNWFLLEFSTLGFIGKLFHSHHLFSIASYLLKNFQKRPCDLMLGQLRDRFGQSKILFSGVSLFQHIGKISTLNNKIMPAVDKKFKNFGSHTPLIMKLPDGGVRPEATFKTNMRIISRFPPENVYKNNSHFYTDVVKRNHYFQILFKEHLNMSRLLISTGSSLNKAHILNNGILKIGANEERGTFCRNVHYIGKFVNGEIDTLIQGFKLPLNIDCIHIEVTRSQRFPLIIRDLKVYLEKIPGIYTASIL